MRPPAQAFSIEFRGRWRGPPKPERLTNSSPLRNLAPGMEIPEDTVAQPGAIEKRAYAEARQRLIGEIEAEAKDTRTWTGRARFSDRVMAALARVPRHVFVPPEDISSAYVNRPLSIGHGQTISQPFIIAVMTSALGLRDFERVLEVGTGSGYQVAILSLMVPRGRVVTVERARGRPAFR